MREVAPGDVVFSFVDTLIIAIGIARTYCYESPKPTEFGTAGSYWGAIGWKVDVSFREVTNRVRPKDHIDQLRSTLPEKYSPLRSNGDGLQSVYLTAVSPAFADIVFRLIGQEANQVADMGRVGSRAQQLSPASESTLDEWERRVEAAIRDDRSLENTEREALVQARRGQGVFRANVQAVERSCRVTKVERREHLIASHVKPWRDSSNDERLDGENGLLLTPTIDHLFDKGFISFEDRGDLIISPVADFPSLQRMGVPTSVGMNVGSFSEGQRRFLEYHRSNVLRKSEMGNAKR